MKKKIAIAIALFFVGAFAAIYMFTLKTEKAISGDADFAFSSAYLLNQYATLPEQSDSLYLDKTIQVEGTIKSVSAVKNGVNVELNSGEEMETVTGTIDSTQLPEELVMTVGRNVVLKGRCAGYLEEEMLGIKNVSIVQCSIQTK